MATIHTVLGNIEPADLGITYGHEHLLFQPHEPLRSQDPDMALDDLDAAVREARLFSGAGGRCLVEMTTVDLQRDPNGLKTVSQSSGVHVIAATGFNKAKFCEAFVSGRSVEQLASDMVRDLLVGMDGTPIRAGLIKASSSKDTMTPVEENVFRAAALAHERTGAPVSTHTEAGTFALEQIDLLTRGGVPPQRMLIGHLDRKLEWETLLAVARRGVFMGFDQISKEKYFPDSARIAMIKRLVEAGHAGQILLGGDLARKSYWPSYGFGKGPGLTYILWRFVPWMLEAGIPLDAVEQMLVRNPARLFAW